MHTHFNNAFLGEGGIEPGGSGFGITICEIVEDMIPLSNKKLVQAIQGAIPSADTRSLLGKNLASRVTLCAPFLNWMDEDGEIVLPEGLEAFDATAAQRVMDNWDPTDDGRDRYY